MFLISYLFLLMITDCFLHNILILQALIGGEHDDFTISSRPISPITSTRPNSMIVKVNLFPPILAVSIYISLCDL